MSVDTPAGERAERNPRFTCAICREAAGGEDARFLAAYPSDDDLNSFTSAEADGLLPLCHSCTEEVTELTEAWTPLERPPVGNTASIGESYASIAEACSFCDGQVADEPVLGVESWANTDRENDGTHTEHDNYALCPSCVTIFEEFLAGISPE